MILKNNYRKIIGIGLCISLAVLLISWMIPSYSSTEYTSLVESGTSEFTATKTFDNISFNLSLRPPSYLALKELEGERPERSAFKKAVEDYQSTNHYVLRMQKSSGGPLLKEWAGDNENYQYLINYLAFDVKHDFKLMGQRDTFECQFVHFERNFDLAPFAQVQLGFNTPESINPLLHDEEWVVQFNAEQFGLGPLKFRFMSNKLITNPTISF